MAINILYFSWVREMIGVGQEQVEPPKSVQTVVQLVDWLSAQSPVHHAAFIDRDRLRAAVDQVFVSLDAPLGEAVEVALFPPVTGGC